MMKSFNESILRLWFSLIIIKAVVVCLEASNHRQPSKEPEVIRIPLAPKTLESSTSSTSSLQSRILDRISKPSKDLNKRVNSTSVKKVTEDIEEEEDDVTTLFPFPRKSDSSKTSSSSLQSRILDRTTTSKSSKKPKPVNTTSLKKVTEDTEEDDATTHFPSPITLESSTTMDFRPSVHIGEIRDYDSRKSAATGHPFNKVHHVKFENSVAIDDHNTGRVPPSASSSLSSSAGDGDRANTSGRAKSRVNFFPTASRYSVAVPVEYYVSHEMQQPQQHDTQEIVENEDNGNYDHHNNDNEDNNHNQIMQVPVQHENVPGYPASHYAEVTLRPMTLEHSVYPAIMTEQHHLHHYEPGVNGVRTIYVKPSKFHGEVATPAAIHVQHYEYVAPAHNEAPGKPETVVVHQQQHGSYQPQGLTHNGLKPETVLFLSSHRETAFTRTRNFPYKYYHPETVDHGTEHYYAPEEQHAYMPREKKISPWKKIIHLIGAFIPLGLLLAALKPNVIQVENTTQPNIVLSKLRDLPIEHKLGRLDNTCEDKSICELIVSGSKPHANLLQNILWDLTNKSSDEEAEKHGLREIFAAVKQKDCSSIDC